MNLKFESTGILKDYPVSDLAGKFIIFKQESEAQISDMIHNLEYLNSKLVFGYVFPLIDSGLHILKLTTASLDEDNNITMHEIQSNFEYKLFPQENIDYTVKFSDVEDSDFIFTDDLGEKFSKKYYDSLPFIKDDVVEKICKNKKLDQFRDCENPLIVNVEGHKIKLENAGSYGFVGKIISEVKQGLRVLLKFIDKDLVIDKEFGSSENEKIILEIRSKLKNNKKAYLKSKFIQYQDNPEVVSVVLDKYVKELDGFDRDIFKSRATKYMDEILPTVYDLIDLSKSGGSELALAKIRDYISNYSCSEDYIIDYIEKDIFMDCYNEAYFIARQDISYLYMALGVICRDNGLGSEALDSFKQSYYLNPVNVCNLIELAIYYLDVDLDKCKKTLDLAFTYTYTRHNLQELYYVLQEYYLRVKDMERFELVGRIIEGEININDSKIQVGFHDEIIDLVCSRIAYHINAKNKESAMYYINILMDMDVKNSHKILKRYENFIKNEYIEF